MTETRAVVAEGVESATGTASRPPSRWIWLAIGLIVGFGLGLVVLTGSDESDVVSETGTTLPTPEATASGVRDYVAGFADGLVVVAVSEGQNLERVIWPAGDDPVVTALAVAADSIVRIDQSGDWMAVGSPFGEAGELFLTVGTTSSNVALDSSATGFSWHDSDKGSLAFSRAGGRQWRLVTAQPPSLPRPVDVPAGTEGALVAFGEWGYALQDGDQATLIDNSGNVLMIVDGTVLDSHPEVGFVVLDGEIGGISLAGEPFDIRGSFSSLEPIAAAVSPDGAKVAVTGAKGVKVAPLGETGEVTEMFTTAAPRSVAWTSDSRFVVVPMVRGVAVIDTVEGGVPIALMENRQVVAVGTMPGGARTDTLYPWQR